MVGVNAVQAVRHSNAVNTEPLLLSDKCYLQNSNPLRFAIIQYYEPCQGKRSCSGSVYELLWQLPFCHRTFHGTNVCFSVVYAGWLQRWSGEKACTWEYSFNQERENFINVDLQHRLYLGKLSMHNNVCRLIS